MGVECAVEEFGYTEEEEEEEEEEYPEREGVTEDVPLRA